jgi:hypothetical protein
VLPVYRHRNIKYAILAREAYGKDRGTYDDFGGSRDVGENHPVVTAAREWDEEGLVHQITGLSEREILDYIDIAQSDNTECIVAYSRSEKIKAVVYITNVAPYKSKLLHNFYKERNRARQFKNKEKDRIACVQLTELRDALVNSDGSLSVQVYAYVLDPKTNKFNQELVTLRPFFVSKLRSYFLDTSYRQGLNKKIRFYFEGQRVPVRQSWSEWFRSFFS